MNLIRFNVNLSEFGGIGKLTKQSPDYILEKYNHWIGFEPCSDWSLYTPDSCDRFINEYYKIWKNQNLVRIHRQLIYLDLTRNIKLSNMIFQFEKYIGPIDLISSEVKSGLHELLEKDFIPKVLEINKNDITTLIRDVKISNLV